MKVYYAHCMDIYHTQQEKEDIQKLENLGFEVINPSDEKYEEAWEAIGMDFADVCIGKCDAVAFRRTLLGKIPSGVAYEIDKALELNLPIFELPTIAVGDILTYPETKAYMVANPSEYYKKRMAQKAVKG